MTAHDADKRRAREDIADKAHCHPETVKAFLRGYPTDKDDEIRAAALAMGVDLATIPVLPPEVIEQRRERLRPKCKRCRELEKRVAELEADGQDLARRTVDLARRFTKLRAFAAGLVQQLRDADEEFDSFQREAERAGKRTVDATDREDAAASARRWAIVAAKPVVEDPATPPPAAEFHLKGELPPEAAGALMRIVRSEYQKIPKVATARRPGLRIYLPGSESPATMDEVAALPEVLP